MLGLAWQLQSIKGGKPSNVLMRLAFFLVQFLDGFKTTTDNVNGRLLEFSGQAGLQNSQEAARYATMFGTLALYKASKRRNNK